MFRICVLLSIICAVLGAHIPNGLKPLFEGRIVGGQATTIEEFPWQVSLVYFDSHKCGAAIITEKAVLTAGHCTEGAYETGMKIRAGTTLREKGGILLPVYSVLHHTKYDKTIYDFDISLILVETKFVFSDSIQPIALPAQDEPIPDGSVGLVSGYGRLTEKGALPETLQYVSVPILSFDQCVDLYGSDVFTSNMFCAGSIDGGIDACQQDSGGPLVANKKLVGIVSWGRGCGRPNRPGAYTRVAAFREWIDSRLGLYSNTP